MKKITIEVPASKPNGLTHFYAELSDLERPDGQQILATATGDAKFVQCCVVGWMANEAS